MKLPRPIVLGAAAFLVVLVTGLPACKNSNSPVTVGGTKELDSGTIAPGAKFLHTFSTAGTYHYCCDIHGCAQMNANVTVAPGSPATAAVTITNDAFSGDVAVEPGGTVTWTNNGSSHTVTSH